jgi:transcriptional regulator with XRE-family HTH domain
LTQTVPQRPFGELLRHWREHRRRSQLDLALDAEISTRHLSFVETGRATPSREMVLRLAERLDVPLRERNTLLLSAGYAPAYLETPVDAPRMSAIREAIRQVLGGHEPYPAVALDRHWNVVEANRSVGLFLDRLAPELLEPPVNVLRASLHPRGMAPHIVNLGELRGHLLERVRRQIALTDDPELRELYAELRSYPGDNSGHLTSSPAHGDVVARLRIHHGERELSFFSILASFGTPMDITVDELAIESFFPADAYTAEVLRAQ